MAVSGGVVILFASFSLVTGTAINVAQGKPTWMSSQDDDNRPASRAVDGVTRADSSTYIVHTAEVQTSAWWKLDLQTPVQSAKVTLYFRTDYKKRRNGEQLYTSRTNSSEPKEGNLCHTVTGSAIGTDIPDVLNVNCLGTWRYLTVYTETDNDESGAILDFAEVQVWMLTNCSEGRYGPNCTEFCNSRNCKTPSPVCDITGLCTDGCREGWQNADCRIPCPSGEYGSNCSKSCDSRQCKTARTACDHVSGACTSGCQEGWIGADCTQRCKPGTYGPGCSRCGYCDVTCNVGDGRCPGECLDGFTGDRCDVDLRASAVTVGVIGGAVGVAIGIVAMLLLGGWLLKRGTVKWITSNGADPPEGAKTGTCYTEGIPTRTPAPGVKDPDYTELNECTKEREEMSLYDVIQNQVDENNQI